MKEIIHIRDLSVFPTPPKDALMVVLKAYFDDSGEEIDPAHKVCSLAGYIGDAKAWRRFEKEWPKALKEQNIEYFHSADLNAHVDIYKHLRGQEAQKKSIHQAMGGAIKASRFRAGICSVIRLDDLRKFNADNNLSLDAYALNLYFCMIEIANKWPFTRTEVILDRISKPHLKLDLAKRYLETDNTGNKSASGFIMPTPLEKEYTFRNILPIQAADYLAWECRKDVLLKSEWFEETKPNIQDKDWASSAQIWVNSKGHSFPHNRGSMAHLLSSTKASGYIWDYAALQVATEHRKGPWPSPSPQG
jgi:hypothetical protein